VRYRSFVSKQVAAELEISIKDACVTIPTHQIKLMETYDRGDTRQRTMNEGKQFEALIFHIFVFMCMSARIKLRIVAIDESSRKRARTGKCEKKIYGLSVCNTFDFDLKHINNHSLWIFIYKSCHDLFIYKT